MEDLRQRVVNIIKYNNFYKDDTNDLYCYPKIPDKMVAKFKKHFKVDVNVNLIAVLLDSSFFKSGKEGIIFTTTGMYVKQMFLKEIYFNYIDIVSVKKDIYLEITLKNGMTIKMSEVGFYEEDLKKLLFQLRDFALVNELSSKRESGTIKMPKKKMPEDLQKKCHAIIHSVSVSAGVAGAGFAQVPLADSAIITPAQIGMIIALGKVFDLEIPNSAAKATITSFGAMYAGRGIVQVLGGWIPGVGNAINTATAAGLTEVVGWSAAYQFYNESLDNISKYSLHGEKKGYEEASEVYELKFRNQAKEMLKQQKVAEEEKEKLNKLIDEYEAYISEHENEWEIDEMKKEVNQLKELKENS